MPSPVPTIPSTNLLARLVVGNPVSGAAHVRRWAQELAYLIGFAQPARVCDVLLPEGGNGTDTITLSYTPSTGPLALHVLVEFHRASAVGARGTVTVATTGALASATWLEANGLDGSTSIEETNQYLQNYPRVEGWLDISACTRGTAGNVTITHVDGGTTCKGIRRVRITEVPRAAFDPVGAPTTEPAVDQSWPSGGNPIVDGSNSVARGLYRVIDHLDTARYKLRRHWQIAALEASSTTQAWSTTSAVFANPNWAVHTGTPGWRFRVRALYGTGTKNKGALRVRYACSNSAATGTVRVIATPVGGAATNYDVTCAAGGSTAFQTATLSAVDLDPSGTDQETDIAIEMKVTAGTFYVCDVCWTEAET